MKKIAGILFLIVILASCEKLTDKCYICETRKEVGMTGEITLRGRVMEIGGVKEKVIAAHRAGLKTLVLPIDNKKDIEEIPEKVQKDIKFVFAEHLDDVLEVAFKNLSPVKWPIRFMTKLLLKL